MFDKTCFAEHLRCLRLCLLDSSLLTTRTLPFASRRWRCGTGFPFLFPGGQTQGSTFSLSTSSARKVLTATEDCHRHSPSTFQCRLWGAELSVASSPSCSERLPLALFSRQGDLTPTNAPSSVGAPFCVLRITSSLRAAGGGGAGPGSLGSTASSEVPRTHLGCTSGCGETPRSPGQRPFGWVLDVWLVTRQRGEGKKATPAVVM